MDRYTAYAPCPCCFESSGYVWEHGNDWESGPWSHQTNIPCRACNGTGLVEADDARTLDDLENEEWDADVSSWFASICALARVDPLSPTPIVHDIELAGAA